MPRRTALGALLGGLAVVLAGCGHDEAAPPLWRLAEGAVVLAFGDSLTHGTGAQAQESYPVLLEEIIGRRVVRSGVPGELSEDGLARLPGELEAHSPRLLILCHGGNDLLRRRDPAATEANLRAMVTLAREAGTQVVLVGVPRPGLRLQRADFYDRIAADLQLPYLPDTLSEILADRDLKTDAAHPNAAGYRRFAEALAALLEDAGAL